MSKQLTPKEIVRLLTRKDETGHGLSQWDNGYNTGVQQYLFGMQYNMEEDGYFENGLYVHPENAWEEGYNEGTWAAKAYENGDEDTVAKEKTKEQLDMEFRMKCFTQAQQMSPRRMNGMDPEPPAETIKRAQYLEQYFRTGELLGEAKGAA